MRYNVHVYREMRPLFEGIEADTPQQAAAEASGRDTADADDIYSCDGETFAALVDVVSDEQYEQSRMIDFEGERLRKAAPQLLEALQYALEFLEANDDGEQDIQERIAKARAVIAAATSDPLPGTMVTTEAKEEPA